MVNAVIIEDGAAMEEMALSISSVAADIFISSRLDSVSKGIEFLSQNPPIDIIFSSVQLSDGLSFEIFDYTNTCIPVIFVSKDDRHLKEAIEYNCIAYLLKPLDPIRLRRALTKYKVLHSYFANGHAFNHHHPEGIKHCRHRMIVKKGKENIALPISDIVLFRTEHRSVHVYDNRGHEYVSDKSLCDIETELDKEQFFRVNRQYIINLNFIYGYRTYERVKLLVELTVPEIKHTVIVSQEMAPQFREWIYNA